MTSVLKFPGIVWLCIVAFIGRGSSRMYRFWISGPGIVGLPKVF